MAFRPSNAAADRGPSNDSWKADGFLNLYLPTKEGGKRKLGAIPLKGSNANEANLLKWLEEDTEARVATLLKKLVVEYRSAQPKAGSEFALEG